MTKFPLLFLALSGVLSAQPLPLDPKLNWWTIDFSTSRSQQVKSLSPAGIWFDFAGAKSGLYTDYLLYAFMAPTPLQSFVTVTLNVVTTGAPVFGYLSEPGNTCVFPAHVRAYFETGGSGEFDRWWANPIAYVLGPGTVTLTVPIAPYQWSSLYGKFGNFDAESLAGFQNASAGAVHVGLSFGGGCFFGHGVNVSGGTAQFQLLSYSIF